MSARVVAWLGALYFTTASWLSFAGVTGDELSVLKAVALFGFVSFSLAGGSHALKFRLGPLLGCVVLGATGTLPLLFTDDGGDWWRLLFDLALPAVLLASAASLGHPRITGMIIRRTAVLSSLITIPIVFYALAASSWRGATPGVMGIEGMFTVSRAGWSAAIAIVAALNLATAHNAAIWQGPSMAYVLTTVLLVGQLSLGGRTGIVGTLVASLIIWVRARTARPVALVVGAIAAGVLVAPLIEVDVVSHFRLSGSGQTASEVLDEVSSGRFGLVAGSLEQVRQLDIFGGGRSFAAVGDHLPHITWLRMLLTGGLVHLIAGVGVLWVAVNHGLKHGHRLAVSAVLGVGIVLSMLQPSFPFGSGHIAAYFWLSFGLVDRSRRDLKTPFPNRKNRSFRPTHKVFD